VVVLKGAGTVVTDSQKVYVNKTGNPGMATAGSGDVLTGVMTALLGQGLSSFDAAVLAVYIHGLAGDIAAEKTGQISLIATDIIQSLPDAFLKHK
jgi:NAD(P)H-hydrate epimerase